MYLLAQVGPVYLTRHMQSYDLPFGIHFAPFLHGFGSHAPRNAIKCNMLELICVEKDCSYREHIFHLLLEMHLRCFITKLI